MEARWQVNDPKGTPTRILALTGMSSLEDKRRAFEAGVDG
jgi:CheY-like chemotaxis protein